jgi:hypothetical protein
VSAATHFTIAMLGGPADGRDGLSLHAALQRVSPSLHADEMTLYRGDDALAVYSTLTPEEAGPPWSDYEPPEKVLGRVLHFVRWSWVPAATAEDRLFLASRLLEAGLGPCWKGSTLRRDLVKLRSYPLTELLEKQAFQDGAALLDESAAYREYLARTLAQRLEPLELSAELDLAAAKHWFKPKRLRTARGRRILFTRRKLAQHAMDLWSFDWAVLDDDRFWELSDNARLAALAL